MAQIVKVSYLYSFCRLHHLINIHFFIVSGNNVKKYCDVDVIFKWWGISSYNGFADLNEPLFIINTVVVGVFFFLGYLNI